MNDVRGRLHRIGQWVATGRRPLIAAYALYVVLWWSLVNLHDFPATGRLDGLDLVIMSTITSAMIVFWLSILVLRREWTLESIGIHLVILGDGVLYGFIILARRQGWITGYREAGPGAVRAAIFEGGLFLLAALAVIAWVWWRARGNSDVLVPEATFGVLAKSMNVVVADAQGVIRFTTPGFDELVGASPNELYGRDLTTLMPERYQADHRSGLERFRETGESRIMGRVVQVDLLRRDGSEIPISLALSSGWKNGDLWMIATVWRREDEVDL